MWWKDLLQGTPPFTFILDFQVPHVYVFTHDDFALKVLVIAIITCPGTYRCLYRLIRHSSLWELWLLKNNHFGETVIWENMVNVEQGCSMLWICTVIWKGILFHCKSHVNNSPPHPPPPQKKVCYDCSSNTPLCSIVISKLLLLFKNFLMKTNAFHLQCCLLEGNL